MSNERKFDLEERTALFGESVIEFAKIIPQNPITLPVMGQFVKSGTAIGANYCEADSAESRKDFEHKMGICKKESKETRYWLRMIAKSVPDLAEQARILWKESNELLLIFSFIIKKSRDNGKLPVKFRSLTFI